MKKILTFAVAALLLGGFVFNANAQTPLKTSKTQKATVTLNNNNSKISTVNPDQLIKEYENAVEQCLVIFDAINNKDASVKGANPKEFNRVLKDAETKRGTIEKIKVSLNRTQSERFDRANKKLSRVYQK